MSQFEVRINESLDAEGINFPRIVVIGLCFLINVADGFDIVAISMTAPSISQDWGISTSDLGMVFSAALAGMMLGAMVLSPLSDLYGRRKLILFSLSVLSVSMFAVTKASTIEQLLVIRFITGLGIGAILASATSIASEIMPAKYRNSAVVFVTLGYPVGTTIVGPVSQLIMEYSTWQSVFLVGGLFTLFLLILSFLVLSESIAFQAARYKNDKDLLNKINSSLRKLKCPPLSDVKGVIESSSVSGGSVLQLFREEYRKNTLLLWVCCFSALMASYFLLSWLPSLFVTEGMGRDKGIFALSVLNFAGVIGVIGCSALLMRYGATRVLTIMMVVAGLLMIAFGFSRSQSLWLILPLLFLTGVTLVPTTVGLYAVAADLYPTLIRTTGVGWSIGMGRTGAIVGPLATGWLLSLDWNIYSLFLVFGSPLLLASLALTKIKRAS